MTQEKKSEQVVAGVIRQRPSLQGQPPTRGSAKEELAPLSGLGADISLGIEGECGNNAAIIRIDHISPLVIVQTRI